ncbi:hypothetical protein M3Y97_01109900 [Aphelenchoides bicaudatus]|nr:hypothetical protein M3Y97_01109900 [Aphelenchoides bicaudatus]
MVSFNSGLCASTVLLVVQVALAAVTLPPIHGRFDYQIGGNYTPKSDVAIVARDKSAPRASKIYSICYINAFQTQPNEKEFWTSKYSDLLLKNSNGELIEDPEWEDEYIFDTSVDEKRTALFGIVKKWIDECAKKEYNAIEPDNLDSYTRSENLLTKENNLAFAKQLATYAHSRNLAFAQKNDATVTKKEAKNVGFDFGIVEECQPNEECGKYDAVYGDQWIEIEYTDSDDADKVFSDACAARGSRISLIQRDRNVTKPSDSEYVYNICP